MDGPWRGKSSQYVTNHSAFNASEVDKSSTGLSGWG